MNISILYFSVTGSTKKMAEIIAKGCNQIDGITAKTMSIDNIDEVFLKNSSCVILGTPTYFSSMTAEVKTWLEKKSGSYMLKGKLGGAFATAAYIYGGADLAIQEILSHFLVSGMMVYSSGCACGNPPIHLGPVAISDSLDQYENLFLEYGRRMATQAKSLA